MTRLPAESWDMVGLEGPDYPGFRTGPTCSVPGCTRFADHAHHLVRRSFLAGDYKWVRMPDGVEIGNLTGLCFAHHNDVTDNKTNITYDNGVFYWDDSLIAQPIEPQPPTKQDPEEEPEPEPKLWVDPVLTNKHERATCPTCKRPLPKPKIETPVEEKKNRATWGIAVPIDERENGYQVLDELLEAAREKLEEAGLTYSADKKAKYHILAITLGLFVQNSVIILGDS